VCLTDLRLPDGDGIDFIRSARAEGARREVVVLTGNASIDTAVEAMKAGAFDYLVKPLQARQIEAVLRRLSEKRGIERQLEDREKRFRSLIEHSSDAIALIDPSGRIGYASPSTLRVLGYPAERFVGGQWFDLLQPDDAPAARALLASVLRRPGDIATGEHRMWHSDSTWRWMEVVFSNLVDEASVGAVVVNYRDVTYRRRMVDDLAFRAFHDTLTGLPNRSLFLDRLAQAIARARREDGRLAAMFIDLDNLKQINDSVGHAAGDELLRAVAGRLRACVREVDTLARVGGDEFMLLIPEIAQPDDAVAVASKALACVAQPYRILGHTISVTTSIGIAYYPDDARDPEGLMSRADRALYRAKATGRNRYVVSSSPE
jgi:diguanylate cyclase (GGDEF)-like protein/PAS domain S-box-containing protein